MVLLYLLLNYKLNLKFDFVLVKEVLLGNRMMTFVVGRIVVFVDKVPLLRPVRFNLNHKSGRRHEIVRNQPQVLANPARGVLNSAYTPYIPIQRETKPK